MSLCKKKKKSFCESADKPAENFTHFCILCKLKTLLHFFDTTFLHFTNMVYRHDWVLNFGLNASYV